MEDTKPVSKLVMCPLPQPEIDVETHLAAERDWRRRDSGSERSTTFFGNATPNAGPAFESFKEKRCQYRKEQKARSPSRRRWRGRARYRVSSDGVWALERVILGGDMCLVQERFIFNVVTGERLQHNELAWLSLDPPYEKSLVEPDSRKLRPMDLDALSAAVQYQRTFTLKSNYGCHDEYPGDIPEPDYESGPRTVTMEEVALREPRGIHTTIQVVRASDYHDTWDRVGRHWICPLPLNPLGDVVHEALARFLPWELKAASVELRMILRSRRDHSIPVLHCTDGFEELRRSRWTMLLLGAW